MYIFFNKNVYWLLKYMNELFGFARLTSIHLGTPTVLENIKLYCMLQTDYIF